MGSSILILTKFFKKFVDLFELIVYTYIKVSAFYTEGVMKAKIELLIKFFKKNGGIVKFSSILKAGFHPDILNNIDARSRIEKVARGLYCLAGYIPETYPDLVLASLQAPKGVICLISALYFHEATTEIPKHVDIALSRNTRISKIEYPLVKFYQFGDMTWRNVIEYHKIEKRKIPIYNLAKTVADCFKFRNRIGIDVAREALKIAIKEKGVSPTDIMFYAEICRVHNIVKPILEAML